MEDKICKYSDVLDCMLKPRVKWLSNNVMRNKVIRISPQNSAESDKYVVKAPRRFTAKCIIASRRVEKNKKRGFESNARETIANKTQTS